MEKQDIRKQYNEILPLYDRASKNIQEALIILLKDNEIPFLTITSRIKEFESFFEKINRKNYVNPFVENEDFCGARIILYYHEDIEKVKKILIKEFNTQNNEDKSEQLDVNEFGYRSHHFIVKFKNQWLTTPNYRGLQNLNIEIQVRTILMHAWAEIEHKLEYKNKDQIPKELSRKLFMISAKLEEADDQFQELKENIQNYKNKLITKSNKEGKFISSDFNLNSFQALLDFYFPELEKHPVMTADLYKAIQERNIGINLIIEYAEKIKPLLTIVEKLVNGSQTNYRMSQANLMAYAIEAFRKEGIYREVSNNRQKIINKIKSLTS